MLRLAPGVALRIELPAGPLEEAVRAFLAQFPEAGPDEGNPLVLGGPPRTKRPGPWQLVAETPPLALRSCGAQLRLDSPAGTGWIEGDRAGIEAPPGQEAQAVGLLLGGLLLELGRRGGLLGVHAAAVAVDGRAALLPAPSGSGKSTLFREAARLGLDLLSDDLLWLRPGREGATLLHPFPRGAPCEPAPPPSCWEAELAWMVFPSITPETGCRVEPTPFDQALSRLLSQCAPAVDAAGRAEVFRRCVRTARSVPRMDLAVGPEPAQGARRIRELLTGSDPA